MLHQRPDVRQPDPPDGGRSAKADPVPERRRPREGAQRPTGLGPDAGAAGCAGQADAVVRDTAGAGPELPERRVPDGQCIGAAGVPAAGLQRDRAGRQHRREQVAGAAGRQPDPQHWHAERAVGIGIKAGVSTAINGGNFDRVLTNAAAEEDQQAGLGGRSAGAAPARALIRRQELSSCNCSCQKSSSAFLPISHF